MVTVTDPDKCNQFSGVSPNSSRSQNLNSIGSYEVDFEKLARELVLPSLDAPLTSYKPINNIISTTATTNSIKPTLQASKTVDSPQNASNASSKKLFIRSLTQNK